MGSLAVVVVELGLVPALLFFAAVCLYADEHASALWSLLLCIAARYCVQILWGNSALLSSERQTRQAVELQRAKLQAQDLTHKQSRLLEAVNECLQRDSDSSGTLVQLQRSIERIGRATEELTRNVRSMQHRQSVEEQRINEDEELTRADSGRIM